MDPFALGVGLVLLCAVVLVIRAGMLRHRRQLMPRRQKVILWVGVVTSLLLIDMYYVEPRWIEVERVTIHDSRLAEVMEGIRVVQISDLHVPAEPGVLEENLVHTVNRLDPDLLVITGDFVSDVAGKEAAVAVTGRLRARLGKYGVPGNNDNYRYKPGEMRKLFPAAGVTILVNEHRRIPLPNGRVLNLAGVNDPVTGQARLDKALDGIPADEPVVLLAHAPEILPEAAGQGIDLLLVGHTHGGQFGLSWPLRWHSNGEPAEAMHGLQRQGRTLMYINRGIGTTTAPLRFLCRPEVTLFEFIQ